MLFKYFLSANSTAGLQCVDKEAKLEVLAGTVGYLSGNHATSSSGLAGTIHP